MGRGPYEPAINKLADCMCGVEKDTVKSYYGWAQESGMDVETIKYYARDLNELNIRTFNKCKRRIVHECAKPGLKADPPDETYRPLEKGNNDLGIGICLASLLGVGVAALARGRKRVDTVACTQCGYPIPVCSVGSKVSCPNCSSIFEVVDLEEV